MEMNWNSTRCTIWIKMVTQFYIAFGWIRTQFGFCIYGNKHTYTKLIHLFKNNRVGLLVRLGRDSQKCHIDNKVAYYYIHNNKITYWTQNERYALNASM